MRKQIQGLAVVAMLVTALVAGPVAWAHAKLVRADPTPGSTVRTTPKVVRTVFNEELNPRGSTLVVVDPRGRRVDDGKGGVDLNDLERKSMVVRIDATRPGTYTVRWTAVSADDAYVAKGAFRFRVATGTRRYSTDLD